MGAARAPVLATRYTGAVNPRLLAVVALTSALLASALGGCGGPMQPEELARSVGSLASSASEGRLLARDVALDRTKATFARAHARELEQSVDHEAEKLNDATAGAGIGDEKSAAVRLAQEISDALGQIRVAPTDRAAAAQAERTLDRLSKRSDALEKSL